MPTQTKTLLPLAQRTNLDVTSPAVDIPANLKAFTIRMTGTGFNTPDKTCALQVTQSMDGGQGYTDLAGFTAAGAAQDRFGNPVQPKLRVELTNEQRDAALMKVAVQCVGTWAFGFAVDLET